MLVSVTLVPDHVPRERIGVAERPWISGSPYTRWTCGWFLDDGRLEGIGLEIVARRCEDSCGREEDFLRGVRELLHVTEICRGS